MKATRSKTRRSPVKTKGRPKKSIAPKIVIVGFGRIGGALAIGLAKVGWEIKVFPRSEESVRRTARLRLPLADHDDLRAADVCILAVPDGAIVQAADLVDEDLGKTTAMVHCSGALPLTSIGTRKIDRPLGSFHPLVAVSDSHDELSGHSVAISATTRKLVELLEKAAVALGLAPLEVPESGRSAYHAGAVLAAGHLVALLDGAVSAFQHAGIDRSAALVALLPLMRSALEGVERRGIEKALTGPVVRGDVGIVQAHLEALPSEIGSVYRLLSRRALMLTPALPPETRAALERVLL